MSKTNAPHTPASAAYDFKAQAQALLKRLGQNPGVPLNQGLALVAVETALREAFARGQGTARPESRLPDPGARPARASVSGPSQGSGKPVECPHEWEVDEFGDPATGAKCVECGILQTEFQARCEHYFVQVGKGEMCLACRKPKRRV